MRIRQRATLLVRLEERSQLRYATAAGIKKAIAALKRDLTNHRQNFTAASKQYRYNNVDIFKNIAVGNATVNVSYMVYPGGLEEPQRYYGFVDEDGKLNINTASKQELVTLISSVGNASGEDALGMALAILGWRQRGETELEGFYSDNFYANRRNPYQPKSAQFEVIDELSLVRGFDSPTIEKLRPFITVYGDGLVNINTAPRNVLIALGLSDVVADKVLFVRRGPDQMDATSDDYVFSKPHDIASEMLQFIKLQIDEIKEIDNLNQANLIKTEDSAFYSMQAKASLVGKKQAAEAFCVYSLLDNKIVYWREKFEYLVDSR